jgi:hypothetical protein
MENKINTFAGLPNDELSKLSEDNNDSSTLNKLRSIEKEFEQTNLHTKNTAESDPNTPNTGYIRDDSNDTETIPKTEKKNRLGKLMGGTLAVDLVDMLIPSIVVLIINYIGYSLEKKDLQLSKSEKEALSPAIQDVLDEIEIDFNNPWVNLGVMLSIVYGSKIIDKMPAMKRKTKVIPMEKKGMSEAAAAIISDAGEQGEELSDYAKFEIDYGKLVDEVRLSRRRGVGDAKQYIAENYSEKIIAIANRHKVPIARVQDQLNYVHNPKKRVKTDFDIENAS